MRRNGTAEPRHSRSGRPRRRRPAVPWSCTPSLRASSPSVARSCTECRHRHRRLRECRPARLWAGSTRTRRGRPERRTERAEHPLTRAIGRAECQFASVPRSRATMVVGAATRQSQRPVTLTRRSRDCEAGGTYGAPCGTNRCISDTSAAAEPLGTPRAVIRAPRVRGGNTEAHATSHGPVARGPLRPARESPALRPGRPAGQ